MSDINSFTHYKVFKPEERGFGRVRLDISKRKYDNRWVVWQKMLSILVDGTFEGPLHCQSYTTHLAKPLMANLA